jgi:glutathione S-transferase
VSSNYVSNYAAYILTGAPATVLLEGAEAIQALLPKETKFAFGNELTAADIAIAPYLLRTKVLLAARGNSDVWPTFQSDEFSRLWKYYQDLEAHPSIAGCYDEVYSVQAAILGDNSADIVCRHTTRWSWKVTLLPQSETTSLRLRSC